MENAGKRLLEEFQNKYREWCECLNSWRTIDEKSGNIAQEIMGYCGDKLEECANLRKDKKIEQGYVDEIRNFMVIFDEMIGRGREIIGDECDYVDITEVGELNEDYYVRLRLDKMRRLERIMLPDIVAKRPKILAFLTEEYQLEMLESLSGDVKDKIDMDTLKNLCPDARANAINAMKGECFNKMTNTTLHGLTEGEQETIINKATPSRLAKIPVGFSRYKKINDLLKYKQSGRVPPLEPSQSGCLIV